MFIIFGFFKLFCKLPDLYEQKFHFNLHDFPKKVNPKSATKKNKDIWWLTISNSPVRPKFIETV